MSSIDWDTGSYERIAPEFAAVAHGVVDRAAPQPGEHLVDIACGAGNAALLAARDGVRVTGVDQARRLLEVAREAARSRGLSDIAFSVGTLESLALADASAEVAVSVFGIIFAADPGAALREAARVLSPGGRLVLSAWVPAGPIDAMLSVSGAAVRRVTGAEAPTRFAWSDAAALAPVAATAGLALQRTTALELEITGESPERYVADGERFHPMALAAQPALERGGVALQTRERMVEVLREANEDPAALRVHSPYVIHELRRDEG